MIHIIFVVCASSNICWGLSLLASGEGGQESPWQLSKIIKLSWIRGYKVRVFSLMVLYLILSFHHCFLWLVSVTNHEAIPLSVCIEYLSINVLSPCWVLRNAPSSLMLSWTIHTYFLMCRMSSILTTCSNAIHFVIHHLPLQTRDTMWPKFTYITWHYLPNSVWIPWIK